MSEIEGKALEYFCGPGYSDLSIFIACSDHLYFDAALYMHSDTAKNQNKI